jgi:hypothetical protein
MYGSIRVIWGYYGHIGLFRPIWAYLGPIWCMGIWGHLGGRGRRCRHACKDLTTNCPCTSIWVYLGLFGPLLGCFGAIMAYMASFGPFGPIFGCKEPSYSVIRYSSNRVIWGYYGHIGLFRALGGPGRRCRHLVHSENRVIWR